MGGANGGQSESVKCSRERAVMRGGKPLSCPLLHGTAPLAASLQHVTLQGWLSPEEGCMGLHNLRLQVSRTLHQTNVFSFALSSGILLYETNYTGTEGLSYLCLKRLYRTSVRTTATYRLASSSGMRFGTKALSSSISSTMYVPASTYCCKDSFPHLPFPKKV